MTFAVESHMKRENHITWGWPGHFHLSICRLKSGMEGGDVTFAVVPPTGWLPAVLRAARALWVGRLRHREIRAQDTGVLPASPVPLFAAFSGLTGAVVGVGNLNSTRGPVEALFPLNKAAVDALS